MLGEAVGITASFAAAAGSFVLEGARVLSSSYHGQASALAVVLACLVGLCIGCCCGLGWGLLLGSAAPQAVARLARAGGALAVSPVRDAAPAARSPAPRPVLRRPPFLVDDL